MNYIKLTHAGKGAGAVWVCDEAVLWTERASSYSLVEDLGSFVTGEVLQLQRLLGEEGHSQVEVVVPQLTRTKTKRRM